MPTFTFNKLVRDKIPAGIKAAGNTPEVRVLDHEEYLRELIKKLSEEASEISNATKDELPSEIADIVEIVSALCTTLNIMPQQLEEYRRAKNEKAGAFSEKLYISTVKTLPDSPWNEMYRKNAHKYPEISDEKEQVID